jgi:hypothetical protein
MSQFNSNNFGNFGPGTYDPVSNLIPGFGSSAPRQNQGTSGGARRPAQNQPVQPMNPFARQSNVAVQNPTARTQGIAAPNLQRYLSMSANQPGVIPRMAPLGQNQSSMQQFMNWDQALANAMGTDLQNQQGAADEMFNSLRTQGNLYEDALQRGIGTLQETGAEQRASLQGIAGGLQQQGQQGYGDFLKYRDQQLGMVQRGIGEANEQAQAAVSGYEAAMGRFQDTSAQDAANAAFGMRRDALAQTQQIDMMDISPGEKAALKQQLAGDVSNQVSQTVTGIFSNMNQQIMGLEGNLANMRNMQSQQTMAGAQLTGQIGTAFGAQTLDAQRSMQQMSELGANLRVMGEQAFASAMNQAVALELQGRKDMADLIQSNPRQFMSMFAGLTGFLAGATTPGINQVGIPNFGAMA